MPLNPDAKLPSEWSDWFERSWTSKDTLLYSLGVGAGATDPTGFELEFTTENSQKVTQRALPTMAVILGGAGGGFRDIGTFNAALLVDGGRTVTWHSEIPVEGKIKSRGRTLGIFEKGKNAIVRSESESVDAESGEPIFNIKSHIVLRGEAPFGGQEDSVEKIAYPDTKPDVEVTYETRSDQALLYRLNGDRNPLHSDPEHAKMAGFPKPILHGLCTYGFTGRALLHGLAGSDPAKLKMMKGQFSKPVMPGDTLTVQMWVDGNHAVYRTVTQDGLVVMDQGECEFVS
jgi:acyl dehydratase